MGAIVSLALAYARRKLLEPSTWAGIVTAAAGSLHITKIDPDLLNAIDTAAVAIVSLLLVAINERRKLPQGTAPVATPAPPGTTAVVVQGQPPVAPAVRASAGASVSSDSGTLVRQPDDPGPKPVRPGFGDHLP